MKHRSLIKDRVRINFIPPTKNCFYIKTFPLTQIFQSVDLKEWTVLNWTLGFFPYSYLSSLSTSEYNNNTVNISFTTLLFGVNVPYRTRGIIMSHEISCDAAPGCLLVFRPLSGRGVIHWTHSKTRSLAGNPQKCSKLRWTKSNAKTTNNSLVSKVIFWFVRQCRNCGIGSYK